MTTKWCIKTQNTNQKLPLLLIKSGRKRSEEKEKGKGEEEEEDKGENGKKDSTHSIEMLMGDNTCWIFGYRN